MDRIENLAVFVRIAETGSFTSTANQLQLPRAAVSTAVQQLEARLGVRLLYRTTRRVSLTPDGAALLERARDLVSDMEEMEQQFRPSPGAVAGRLKVDVPSRIARLLIAPALPGFFKQFPAVELDLGSSDRAVDLVQEGVDCALRVGPLASSSLVARPLGTFELINCASPAYLARHGTPGSPAELSGHWAVNYAAPGGTRNATWDWLDAGTPVQQAMRSRVTVNNAESYIACALAGLGMIQIPAYDVQDHLQSGELVEVLPEARAAAMPVHLMYPHRRHVSNRVQAFSRWLEVVLAPALQGRRNGAA
ncbi:LysR family transcriptional regulator [Rhodoferax koreense]|uniref:LysR family transcriptional regulator n=1 Tax=Rhodoferax koreensis TaxID=1842727 RepID=A0A1P8JVA5_9BURK|nr:LysR family transcriptional regulator [Rhodoferax koreense]APW37683.1 LysR family transcriptional regulator [Rhodoferax koreense]